MKSTILFCLLSVILGMFFAPQSASAFAPVSVAPVALTPTTSTQLFFFGKPKDDGSPGDYVCKDCGYVFTKGPKAWAALDDSKYKCPPCGAPKFRFKKVPKGSESGKVEVKKSWF
ncbi:unnamed protein product [Pseudo-nitzschia multistriata]|uniref:Rubredoxin-like domain-containing protein n=1 Tax=Pseudo-nitzschia multistriata TaxID=183589 RepID=A0A448ZGI0_9STRA|nr:unnamed protein product [Pseudo-nitzschia multistriata]